MVEEALSLNSLDHQALFSFQEHGYCETGGPLEKAVFFLSTANVFVRGACVLADRALLTWKRHGVKLRISLHVCKSLRERGKLFEKAGTQYGSH